MINFEMLEVIQQNIKDLKKLIMDENLNLTNDKRMMLARGVILNLQEHLEEFVSKI